MSTPLYVCVETNPDVVYVLTNDSPQRFNKKTRKGPNFPPMDPKGGKKKSKKKSKY